MTSPLLKTALAGLSLDLDQELKRYRLDQALSNQLVTVIQDSRLQESGQKSNQESDLIDNFLTSEPSFSPALETNLDPASDDVIPDIDTQDWELSYLFDDLSGNLSMDLENTLEEEFQDQELVREFAEISSIQTELNSEETAPNLLSPIGILAMIVLLVSSAAVGYLWVDPSGLKRLIKSDPKPTSALPAKAINQTELFQTSTRDKKEPIPFVDFSISKPSTQRLSKIMSPFLPPIGLGRSFEQPIRVEPEAKLKLEPVVKPKPNLLKPSDPEKAVINSKLDPEPTLSSLDIMPNSLPTTPSAPISTPNLGVSNVLDATRPKPSGEIMDATKPIPNTSPNSTIDTQVKPEAVKEIN